MVANTCVDPGGPTFYSINGNTTATLDHVLVDSLLVDAIMCMMVLKETGRELQISTIARYHDHKPILAEFRIELGYAHEFEHTYLWDYEKCERH